MSFIDSLFGKKNTKTDSKVLDEIKLQYGAQFKREDGSRLYLKPKLDVVGNKLYKSLYDKDVDLIYNFQRFDVLERIKKADFIVENNYDIYMNVDFDKLQDPEFKFFFANVFLSSDRLMKIRDVYFGFAGEVKRISDDSNYMNQIPYIKFVDKNILQILYTEAKTGIMSVSQVGLYRGNSDSNRFSRYENEK